jgi:uncharacterized sulfatase
MHRRHLLAAAASAAFSRAAGAARPPNFIIVLADDLGYGDLGAYGNRLIRTPALDRMARDGVVLTDLYSAANVCTPARAGLLTGRYPIRTGLAYEVILADDRRGLSPSEVTIAKALKPDYASALIGKWHLGHVAPYWPPTRHGFDLFFGLPYSHDMQPLSLFTGNGPGVELTAEDVDYPRLQQRFFDRAQQFVSDNVARPFFLLLALSAPHLPEHPHPAFAGRSRAAAYGDVVEEIDAGVGRLLAHLKRLGLDRDTLVLFTSDNGPWFEGSSGGLRDRKGGGVYDGGYRVPGLVRWPGRVPTGRRVDSLVSFIDILPTFCALAGVPAPDVPLDGVDVSAVLTQGAASPREHLLLFNNEDIFGVRTPRWKLVVGSYNRGRQVQLDRLAPGFVQLYDMTQPEPESYNVADRFPAVVGELSKVVEDARATFEPMRRGVVPLRYEGVAE